MIGWGILGAGNIAHRFVKGLSFSKEGRLVAVASHSKEKREEFKTLCPNIVTYDNYDALLEDENVNVVYLAMWHKDHYRWAKQALQKGKAVLCEKPAVLSVEEMEDLALKEKKNHVFFMEAMKTRFLPMVKHLKELLEQGVIGKIERVENRFCYRMEEGMDPRYLFEKDQGGILNDVGSYNIASLLDYIHAPIEKVENKATFMQGVDVHDRITIRFKGGQTGFLEMAMDERKSPEMVIYGDRGTIVCEPFYRPEKIVIARKDGKIEEVCVPYDHDDFYSQIEEVERCLNAGKTESERMSLNDSIEIQKVIRKIREVTKDPEI